MTEAARRPTFPRPVPNIYAVSTTEKLFQDQEGEHCRRNSLDELEAIILAAEAELDEDKQRLDRLVERIETFVSRREALREQTRKVDQFIAGLNSRR